MACNVFVAVLVRFIVSLCVFVVQLISDERVHGAVGMKAQPPEEMLPCANFQTHWLKTHLFTV